MTYDYRIAASLSDLRHVDLRATFASLGVVVPNDEPMKYPQESLLASGHVRGLGLPQVFWHWGFLTEASYDTLKGFCAEKSANVYIRTLSEDREWRDYQGILIWPARPQFSAGRVLDFTLLIHGLVDQGDE